MMYHMVKPCSDSGAFIAEPMHKIRLDMSLCEQIFKDNGYTIKFSSKVILLIEDTIEYPEVGIYPSGKLLFKSTDHEVVKRMFESLKPLLKNCICVS